MRPGPHNPLPEHVHNDPIPNTEAHPFPCSAGEQAFNSLAFGGNWQSRAVPTGFFGKGRVCKPLSTQDITQRENNKDKTLERYAVITAQVTNSHLDSCVSLSTQNEPIGLPAGVRILALLYVMPSTTPNYPPREMLRDRRGEKRHISLEYL